MTYEMTPADLYSLEYAKYFSARTKKTTQRLIDDWGKKLDDLNKEFVDPEFYDDTSPIRKWIQNFNQFEIDEIMAEVEIEIGSREDYIAHCLSLNEGELTPYQIWLKQQEILAQKQQNRLE